MSDDIRSQSLDELDLSVRAYELLSELGVTTFGELVDLPKIEIPTSWPRKIARLVAAEIVLLCEDLDAPYEGEIVTPPLAPAALRATGTVAERWATITAWLEDHHPAALAHWRPAATPAAIADAERSLGVTLPDDYKQFLALANGQVDRAPMVGMGSLLPVEKLASARAVIPGEATPVAPSDVGPGIQPVDYCERWIPISQSSRGRDYLCLDLEPAAGGAVGQILEYVVDDDARPLVAASFAELLSRYFEQIQTGEIDLEDGDDLDGDLDDPDDDA